MVTKVVAWKDSKGKLHESELLAFREELYRACHERSIATDWVHHIKDLFPLISQVYSQEQTS